MRPVSSFSPRRKAAGCDGARSCGAGARDAEDFFCSPRWKNSVGVCAGVGVAPAEEDEDFDFEQTLRDIHIELADLNKEAAELAVKIQKNFEELGA